MNFTRVHTQDEIVSFIQEQKAVILEIDKTTDDNMKEISYRRCYQPTEDDQRWLAAHSNIEKAVMYASEHFSKMHQSYICRSIGFSKMGWFFYLHPKAAEAGCGKQELIATWMTIFDICLIS